MCTMAMACITSGAILRLKVKGPGREAWKSSYLETTISVVTDMLARSAMQFADFQCGHVS